MGELADQIGITFGALAEPFCNQDVGRFLSAHSCDVYQKYSDAITLLRVQGLLADTEAKKARDRLYKRMAKSIRAAAKKKAKP